MEKISNIFVGNTERNDYVYHCRRTIPSLKVKVGAISLITPEPQEQNINVLSVVPYPTYDAVSKIHDLAIVQVRNCFKQ